MSNALVNLSKAEFKYSHWAQRFRDRIAAGELPPGARLPSQNDLYSEFGLSRATSERVYRVLEAEGLVVREHRRGVFVAEPRRVEQAVDTICVICSGFGEYSHHPYYAQLIATVHRMAEADGLRTLLCSGQTLPGWDQIGGLLLISHHTPQSIQQLINQLPEHVPTVSLLSSGVGIASVIADELSGTYEATQHLLQLGHRRIAMLAMEDSQQRHQAYQMALLEAGITPQGEWRKLIPQQSRLRPFEELGYHAMKEWLSDDWAKLRCTAMLCQNDDAAAGVLQALDEAGIRVPDDLSLVGFDGTTIANRLLPRLTTVEMPLDAIVERAWMLLRERSHPIVAERPAPETVMLPTKLRIAQSTSEYSSS